MDKLRKFAGDYLEAHYKGTWTNHSMGVNSGIVLARSPDANEMAARIAVFVTDPKNHDTEVTAAWRRSEKWEQRNRKLADPTVEADPISYEQRLEETRSRIVSLYPELLDDPLGDFPRLQFTNSASSDDTVGEDESTEA